MKLYSDFHDYYDTAVGFGRDENVHYNRYRKEVSLILEAKADFPVWHGGKHFLLGFCGQIFPLIEIKEFGENREVIFCHYSFSFDDVFEQLQEREQTRKQITDELRWRRTKITEKVIWETLKKELIKNRLREFFKNWGYADNSLFLEFKTPLWLMELRHYDHTMILNPQLARLGFERFKDAQTAFQEISMYLSNILVEQKETAEIADKYRLEQHGFDARISFRKERKI